MATQDAELTLAASSGAAWARGERRPPSGAHQMATQDAELTLAASSGAAWAPRGRPAGTAAHRRARPPSGGDGRLPDTDTRRTGGAPAAYPARHAHSRHRRRRICRFGFGRTPPRGGAFVPPSFFVC